MNVSDARPRPSRRTIFVDRRPAPGRTAARCRARPNPPINLENVFQRIGRQPAPCQSGISMSHLKLVAAKETTVLQCGINRFSGIFPRWERVSGRRYTCPILARIGGRDGLQSPDAGRFPSLAATPRRTITPVSHMKLPAIAFALVAGCLAGCATHDLAPSSGEESAGPPSTVGMPYPEKVRRHIRPNIVWSGGVGPPGGWVTVVHIRSAPSGTVFRTEVVWKSGNPEWDAAVLTAVRRSVPLPPDSTGKVPENVTIEFRTDKRPQ
ncbi:energy transducer TonB [Burkholderia cepacia]|uniref:energy transducer TonB n=1 Tax=Burkholderia cepacia TaxID=292 RepID=UPI0009C0372F